MSERFDNGAELLAVKGNVDLAAAPAFAGQVGAILRRRPAAFIIDLTEVNFLATAGMSILMEAQYKSQKESIALRIVARGPITARPMQLLGIDDLLDIYPDIDAAQRGLPQGA